MPARSVRESSPSVRTHIGRVRTQGSDASGRGSEALLAARMDALKRKPREWSKRNRIKKVREMGTALGPPDFRCKPAFHRLRPDASDVRPDANGRVRNTM
jgi:hypothetical protein